MKYVNQVAKVPFPGKFERTREKLVSAIRDEVRESGDFTADLVAKRSGSSSANFYNHFATKDEALIAVYDQLMSDLVALVSDQCKIERLLDEGVQPFMAGWVLRTAQFFADNAALFRLAQSAFGRSKSLRHLFKKYEAAVTEIYRRFIELGQAAGQIRGGDQDTMAQMLTVFSESWHHSLVQQLEAGDPLHDELSQALVRMVSTDMQR
ncbi:MAG: TetR/AcrR family transcriptional regulator [Oceanicoccus sp.]|jgi:AcrR family transcriptional regulator